MSGNLGKCQHRMKNEACGLPLLGLAYVLFDFLSLLCERLRTIEKTVSNLPESSSLTSSSMALLRDLLCWGNSSFPDLRLADLLSHRDLRGSSASGTPHHPESPLPRSSFTPGHGTKVFPSHHASKSMVELAKYGYGLLQLFPLDVASS